MVEMEWSEYKIIGDLHYDMTMTTAMYNVYVFHMRKWLNCLLSFVASNGE